MIAALPALLMLAAQPLDCEDPRNQAEMNECAALAFQEADVALNETWGEVLAYVRSADREGAPSFDDRPDGEAMLRQAQRAWVTFRDAHCTVIGYEARGGSMESMIFDGCRARVTRERIEQLRGLIIE